MENNLTDDLQPNHLRIDRLQTEPAICIRNAYKHYGSNINPIIILNNLNMTVPKGAIYGLLGASGCGKTTLLNCIVGRKKVISGSVWVLGGTPGTEHCGLPGPKFGYMPQSINLYGGFTIRETMQFFGWISGMQADKIEEKTIFFVKLLMLPCADEFVKDLSGGQQRRVSLAVALLHEPELVILDEPTVGLDAILRDNIWNYFLQITNERNTTIVITTHYIDEANQAHVVAFMREGSFLAEESPKKLLSRYNSQTLERVFFALSNVQEERNCINYINNLQNAIASAGDDRNIGVYKTNRNSSVVHHCFCNNWFKGKHIKALLWKNFSWMLRNIPVVLCVLVLPFVQTVLFCLCIGHDPKYLKIATVNYETNNATCENQFKCKDVQLSCHYLKYLGNHSLNLVYYNTEESAIESVLKGEAYASVVIRQNFSWSLDSRTRNWRQANIEDIYSSEITVVRDTSDRLISYSLKAVLYDTFKHFLVDYMTTCNIESRWLVSSIKLEQPVYGKVDSMFIDFITPAMLLTCISFFATALTSMALFLERNEGILERCLVIGINQLEMLLSHCICQFVIMVCQTLITIACFFGIFGITIKGSLTLLTVLALMEGFFGMCTGLLISSIANSEAAAFSATIGCYIAVVVLGGVMWPIEGMHYILQYVVLALPFTRATESARSIMYRGWNLTFPTVYIGFLTVSVWTISVIVIIILIRIFKKE